MKASHSYQWRKMTIRDIGAGMELKNYNQWNQTIDDWTFLISTPDSVNWVVVTPPDNIVGTITCMPFAPGPGWIGMVLVHPDHRRRGLGTSLMQKAMENSTKKSFQLDATEHGSKLYEKLGYKVTGTVHRWTSRGLKKFQWHGKATQISTGQQLKDVISYDQRRTGVGRPALLEYLAGHSILSSICISRKQEICGYCLGRPGSRYHMMGPLLANDLTTAIDLFHCSFSQVWDRPTVIDVPAGQRGFQEHLSRLGFSIERSFLRMEWGKHWDTPGINDIYATAGPEFG